MSTVTKETKSEFVRVCPFAGCRRVKSVPVDLSNRLVKRVKSVSVDPDTLVTKVEYEDVDLQAEIDARVHDCGVDLMRRLLTTGQAKQSDFADPGNAGIDATKLPADVHALHKKITENNDQIASLMTALGVKPGENLTQERVEELLTAKVAEVFAKNKKADANTVTKTEEVKQ